MVVGRFVAVAVAGLAVTLGSLTSPPSAVATPMPYAAALAPAHSALVSAVPADQAVLASGPTELVLTFNEEINPRFAQLALSRSGDVVALNPATATGKVLRATLADPGPGTYRIAYRVVSADGHPISGETSFTVTGPTRTPTSTGATSTAATSTTSASSNPSAGAGAAATDQRDTNDRIATPGRYDLALHRRRPAGSGRPHGRLGKPPQASMTQAQRRSPRSQEGVAGTDFHHAQPSV